MKKTSKLLSILMALVLVLGSIQPVLAQNDNKSQAESVQVAEEAKDKAKDKAEEAKDKAKDKAEEAKDKAKEKAEEAKDKAEEKAEEAKEKAEEAKEEAKEAAQEKNEKIQFLVDKGWVIGRENNDLALDSTITRAEFVKMVLVTKGYEEEAKKLQGQEAVYQDVPADYWANGLINIAKREGYVLGYEDGNFKPEGNITYAEVLAVLSRLHPEFTDPKVQGEDWSKAYIEFARENDYLDDVEIENNDFDQAGQREEVFEIIYNYYQEVGESSPTQTKEEAEKKVEQAEEKAEEAKDKAEEKAEDAKDKAEDKKEEAKEKAEDKKEESTDKN